MSVLSYPEAAVIGLLQGVTELFPVSSLGHSVLLPAVIGGSWAKRPQVNSAESPYLAFIVGLHVATALALIVFFWRDWVRIVGGLLHLDPGPPGPRPRTSDWAGCSCSRPSRSASPVCCSSTPSARCCPSRSRPASSWRSTA